MRRPLETGLLAIAPVVLVAVLAVATGGCGGDDSAPTAPAAVPGTSVVFDLDADLSDPAHFYDLPAPSDLRLDHNGHPDVRGFPLGADARGRTSTTAEQRSALHADEARIRP